jgi:hypothetical protein
VQWARRTLPEPGSALCISGYQGEESACAALLDVRTGGWLALIAATARPASRCERGRTRCGCPRTRTARPVGHRGRGGDAGDHAGPRCAAQTADVPGVAAHARPHHDRRHTPEPTAGA